MNNLPKNTPKSIYLDLGYKPAPAEDFNDLTDVTWSESNATGNGVKYIRGDVADKLAKDATEFTLGFVSSYLGHLSIKCFQNEMKFSENRDEIFTEFINSQKAQKE